MRVRGPAFATLLLTAELLCGGPLLAAQPEPEAADSATESAAPSPPAEPAAEPNTAEEFDIFADTKSGSAPAAKKSAARSSGPQLHGFVQFEAAYAYQDPEHWSKLLTRAEVGTQGKFSGDVKWKLSGRLDYDAVYSLTDFYPAEVARDQRFNLSPRENYLDVSAGDWDFRLGRQHVVWGEMVGLFVADVVSAKDMREFLLPEFENLRIPQWAARAEYFLGDLHAELLWIPVPSYDEIGKPGAEFFPQQPIAPGFAAVYHSEQRPRRTLSNTSYGARLSWLQSGWDVSGFVYRSMDASPTFYRQIVTAPQPAFVFEARHDRIEQAGATVAKDLGSMVLKAESVYTRGRNYEVLRFTGDGVARQNRLDSAIGLDFSLPNETRLNVQLFQRAFFSYDPDLVQTRHANGYSIYLNGKLTDKLEGQLLWLASLNRTDWQFRPRLAWVFEKNWRWMIGADVFGGSPRGLFGQFDNKDRVYSELRYSF